MLTEQLQRPDLVCSSNFYSKLAFLYARNSLFDLGGELVCRSKFDKAFVVYLRNLGTVSKCNSSQLG